MNFTKIKIAKIYISSVKYFFKEIPFSMKFFLLVKVFFSEIIFLLNKMFLNRNIHFQQSALTWKQNAFGG